ncbi:unnamed protein product [Protopolystoma xenopodis]|uniref:Secreted protein n=1 Tax=Protopolystoma xenopodis TaxID=117903 RepID=A0A3S5AC47_9PLAT|nr:unnamed protein product [Protopolystoma xenopodis]
MVYLCVIITCLKCCCNALQITPHSKKDGGQEASIHSLTDDWHIRWFSLLTEEPDLQGMPTLYPELFPTEKHGNHTGRQRGELGS